MFVWHRGSPFSSARVSAPCSCCGQPFLFRGFLQLRTHFTSFGKTDKSDLPLVLATSCQCFRGRACQCLRHGERKHACQRTNLADNGCCVTLGVRGSPHGRLRGHARTGTGLDWATPSAVPHHFVSQLDERWRPNRALERLYFHVRASPSSLEGIPSTERFTSVVGAGVLLQASRRHRPAKRLPVAATRKSKNDCVCISTCQPATSSPAVVHAHVIIALSQSIPRDSSNSLAPILLPTRTAYPASRPWSSLRVLHPMSAPRSRTRSHTVHVSAYANTASALPRPKPLGALCASPGFRLHRRSWRLDRRTEDSRALAGDELVSMTGSDVSRRRFLARWATHCVAVVRV